MSLQNLGYIALTEGEPERGWAPLEEALDIYRKLDSDPWHVAVTLQNLGFVALECDALEQARAYLLESVSLVARLGDPQILAYSLLALAAMAARNGPAESVARLLGAADGLLESVTASVERYETSLRERARIAADLEGRHVESYRAGRAGDFATAVQLAMSSLTADSREHVTSP
jgi:Tfp pilus assembly protein PilF